MAIPASATSERYDSAREALAALPREVVDYRALDDATLLDLNACCAEMERFLGATRALISGEIAYRSRADLGAAGLARRSGHRTAENLLKKTTGATGQQVLIAVRAGVMLGEIADEGTVDVSTGELSTPNQPWLRPLAGAVSSGSVSTSAAESIMRGIGAPDSAVTCAQLEVLVRALVAEAIAGVDADRLFRRARQLRDELDLGGVQVREDERRQQRHLSFVSLPNGVSRLIWTMDPETAAQVKDLYDRMTSPKLGGVRFVSEERRRTAAAIEDDKRTPGESEQRLFSRRQREVLAVKFGGCMHPGCERPPSWTEAHHIDHVKRDGGKTVIENGILLCKWHHLMYHNDGYEISRDEHGAYWLTPPPTVDAQQRPRPMPLKTANLRDLTRTG